MFEGLYRYTGSPHNIELKYLTEENTKVLKEVKKLYWFLPLI